MKNSIRTFTNPAGALVLSALTVLIGGCGDPAGQSSSQSDSTPSDAAEAAAESMAASSPTSSGSANPTNNLYWGDTHLHTNLSPDAYVQRNTTSGPDEAFRFAKGAPVIDAVSRAKVQIDTPLDFLVVADHAEYSGITKMIWDADEQVIATEIGQRYSGMIAEGRGTDVFFELIGHVNTNNPAAELVAENLRARVWSDVVETADRHNDPGNFTAFIGWEWSAMPNGQNLHRIVFLPEGGDVAKQFTPFSAFDSDVESDFWAWLEETSERTGASFVAIPHNGNISNDLMFPLSDRAGNPISVAYANTRMRWEPVMEITQIKGDSETHPALSPNDEFADFETYEHTFESEDAGNEVAEDHRSGSYVRAGLKRGLEIEQNIGVNPFKYGLVGSTDAHTGFASAEEDNFWGKFSLDSIPDNKSDTELTPGTYGWDMSASGLAAVWARENTREAIAEAFKRRETYGTSGPRIALRFFGGFGFTAADAEARNLAEIGYAKGVPMGGDLTTSSGAAPSFLIHAVKDPKSANLDRVQVVKGYLDAEGGAHEQIYNVAWSGDRTVDANGKLAAVGNTVDLDTGLVSDAIGDAQLATVWTDPDFDPAMRAFYYVRVLQIPTPRNSTYDAIALGIDPVDTGKPITIQERAYSSPIWYTP